MAVRTPWKAIHEGKLIMINDVLMLGLAVFSVLIVLMLLKVPISFALCIATIVGVFSVSGLPMMIVAQRMYNSLDSFTLIAVPLFILTGNIMAMGGVTKDLLDFSDVFVGRFRGGLAYVNVVQSMIFAGITGTAQADTASEGSIIIPTMIQKGYDPDFTVGVTASSSTIGILIPPSIPMVLYGIAGGVSIGSLFAGGIVPGVLFGLAQMVICFFVSRKRNYPREAAHSAKESLMICLRSFPALMTIVIIIGGIVSGVFTATEASAIACLYSLALGLFFYKELKLKDIPKLVLESAKTMGIAALMISAATALSWFLTSQGIPQKLAAAILSVTNNKILILLLINFILLFVGMFFDLAPAVTLFTPILLPIAMAVGVDPVHFGIIMVVNLAIGLCTPPVGVCLFLGCSIAGLPISKVIKGFMPFYLVMIAVLLLVTYVPQVSLFLPSLIGN